MTLVERFLVLGLVLSLGPDKRRLPRVEFSRGIPMRMLAIDGTWSRPCLMLDAADKGVKLVLKQSVTGMNLKEFFLVLSTTGSSFRRCEMVWMNGDEIGVRFIEKTMAQPKLSIKPNSSEEPHEI